MLAQSLWRVKDHVVRALINSEVKMMALARGQNLKNRVGGREILPIAG
jgi:hypothetical protein